MKMRTVLIGFLVIVTGFAGFSQNAATGNKLTLQQCIETGLASNATVMQYWVTMEGNKVDMNQARLNLLPDITGGASQNFSQGRSIDPYSNSPVTQGISSSNFNVGGGLILFNGLSLQNQIKRSTLDYQAAKLDWQQAKDNLTIDIILAYLQVLSRDEQLEQAKAQAVFSQKEVERLEILNKEGSIKPSDLSDLKGQYANDRIAIITAQNALETAKINLCQLLNIPYNKDLALERIDAGSFDAKYDNTPDSIYQTALEQLAAIKSVDLKAKSAEKALKVERGRLFPTLSFGVNVNTNYSSVAHQSQYINTVYVPTSDSAVISNVKYPVYSFHDNFTPSTKIPYRDQLNNNLYTTFGFSLNVPIFRRLQQRSRIKQAKITLQYSQYQASSARTRLNQIINQAFNDMVTSYDTYKTIIEQVDALKESFHAAEVRFNEGVGTSYDYLLTKNNLDRANFNLIAYKYDCILRTKVLDYYQGKKLW